MVLLLLCVASVLLAGYVLSGRVWALGGADTEASACGPMERAASTLTAAFVIVLVVSWALTYVHLLDTIPLAGVLVGSGIAAILDLLRQNQWKLPGWMKGGEITPPSGIFLALAVLAPVLMWVAFALYRGWVMPPASHDALAYHMPRAVLIARAHAYEFFDSTTMCISSYPANFELLCADVILLSGSDVVTEWVATASYVYLLVLAAALAERWWGRGVAHVAAVVLLTGLVPAALLPSSAHKNDLLMSDFVLASVIWASRWSIRGGLPAFLMTWASVCAAVGTKLSAPFLIAGLLPLLAWRMYEARNVRWLAPSSRIPVVVSVLALALLLGSQVYFSNIKAIGFPFPVHNDFGFDEGYGDFANLWRFPYLVLARPFSGDWGVWVPWTETTWFWPKNNLYFSSLGITTTVMVLALPIAVWRFRQSGDLDTRRERLAAAVVVVVTLLLTMPIKSRPLGFFGMFTRYITYVPPLLAAWTVAPTLRGLEARGGRANVLAWVVVFGLSGLFGMEADRCARADNFTPLTLVAEVMEHPERARQLVPPRPNAGAAVDGFAGPNDVIAFDGALDAWIYNCFGKDLTRKVIPIHLQPDQPWVIPDEVKYVVIDRNWHPIWANPDFHDMGQATDLLFHGRALPIDRQLFKQMKADPRFKLVWRYAPLEQAVFERVQ